MAQSFSARSRAIEPFHVMALLARANELQAAGHDVIHLEIGEPDFTTAAPIVAAGQAAIDAAGIGLCRQAQQGGRASIVRPSACVRVALGEAESTFP
mgnify:CR=1 FL=1